MQYIAGLKWLYNFQIEMPIRMTGHRVRYSEVYDGSGVLIVKAGKDDVLWAVLYGGGSDGDDVGVSSR